MPIQYSHVEPPTPMDDDLNDSLDDLLGGKIVGERPAPPVQYKPRDFTEPCFKCHGSKVFRRGNFVGKCFACNGEGTKTFKTSRQDRVNAQAAREDRQQRKAVEATEAFKATHPDLFAWLVAQAGKFDFALAMLQAIGKYGQLTDNQFATVERLAGKDRARQAEHAARIEAAPVVEVSALEAAFEKARNYKRLPNQLGVRKLTLRLDTFIFKPASKHPGTIYVTSKDVVDGEGEPLYLGKIVGGRFQATRAGVPYATRVVAAAADPAKSAKAYGERFSQCCACGADLTNEDSITRMMGPVCAEKYGF